MLKSASLALSIITVIALMLATAGPALAQGDTEIEAKFIAMLKKATLKGTWAPVQQGKLGAEKGNDSYRIARVPAKGCLSFK